MWQPLYFFLTTILKNNVSLQDSSSNYRYIDEVKAGHDCEENIYISAHVVKFVSKLNLFNRHSYDFQAPTTIKTHSTTT
jgi:hypothetical protein